MVGARSAAMAFNRLVDAEIDARNPRTRMRHLPGRTCSRAASPGASWRCPRWSFCSLRRGAESAVLSPRARWRWRSFSSTRSPSASPRFRTWCWDSRWASRRPRHGSRCAARSIRAFCWLTAAVTFWTAGFDIIYSCQDYEFDRDERAVQPAAPHRASRRRCAWRALLHVLMIACLLALVYSLHLGALSAGRRGGRRARC